MCVSNASKPEIGIHIEKGDVIYLKQNHFKKKQSE